MNDYNLVKAKGKLHAQLKDKVNEIYKVCTGF